MPCQVRFPGICNHRPETTVLAHYRLIGVSGMGMKSPDFLGAWACSDCHTFVDTNRRDPEIRLAFAEAVFRTQYELDKRGLL